MHSSSRFINYNDNWKQLVANGYLLYNDISIDYSYLRLKNKVHRNEYRRSKTAYFGKNGYSNYYKYAVSRSDHTQPCYFAIHN